jgi:hypothetical protein
MPDPVFFCRQMELMVQATIQVDNFSCRASVLVDTGCRIPLLFRKGLIPGDILEPARRPIRISTADGTPMKGGGRGCVLRIKLPVAGLDGSPVTEFCCEPAWGYEASVRTCDLILGYPFLKICQLVVDCPSDMLKSTATSTSSSSRPTSTSSTFSTRTLTPFPKHSTTLPMSPTAVIHKGTERNSVRPGAPEQGSNPPFDSPGCKVKAAEIEVDGKSSSHPVLRQLRCLAGHPEAGCPVPHQPILAFRPPPPASVAIDGAVINSAITQPAPGSEASTTSQPLPPQLFQCTSCRRTTPLPDFDCGCMSGDICLIPISPRQEAGESVKADHPINKITLQAPDTPARIPSMDQTFTIREIQALTSMTAGTMEVDEWSLPHTTPVPMTTEDLQSPMDDPLWDRGFLPAAGVTHALETGNYRIRMAIFRHIMRIADAQGFRTTVDAFANEKHRCLTAYWSAHADAFSKYWGTEILWINPTLMLIPRIVEKIYRDEARGIMLIPVITGHAWF